MGDSREDQTKPPPEWLLIERYITSIRWAVDTPEYEKGLVAANIRAYHAHLRSTGALKGK